MTSEEIGRLSDDQLSRLIAESVEPPICSGPPCGLRSSDIQEGDVVRWQHRDMVNGPAMTVMLLEKMPCPTLIRGADHWICDANATNDRTPVGSNIQLGRAVAEAFLLSRNLRWPTANKPRAMNERDQASH